MGVFSILDKIFLKIKRTISTKSQCCYPSCREKVNLKKISDFVRQSIAVQTKVYVPINAVACPNHSSSEVWLNANSLVTQVGSEFTKEYLEDMFCLLTNNSLKSHTPAESRKSISRVYEFLFEIMR